MQTFEIRQEDNLFKLYRIENGKEGCIGSFLDLESAENQKVYYEYIAKCGSIFQEGLELTKKLLREHNATKDRPLEFDVFVAVVLLRADKLAFCKLNKLVQSAFTFVKNKNGIINIKYLIFFIGHQPFIIFFILFNKFISFFKC